MSNKEKQKQAEYSAESDELTVVVHSLTGQKKIFTHVKYCSMDTVSGRIQVLPGHAKMSTLIKNGRIRIKGELQKEESADENTKVISKGQNIFEIPHVDALVKIDHHKIDIFEVL